MKFKELKTKPRKELEKLLKDTKSKLFDIEVNLRYGQVKNTSEVKKTKKNIAQILTIFNI